MTGMSQPHTPSPSARAELLPSAALLEELRLAPLCPAGSPARGDSRGEEGEDAAGSPSREATLQKIRYTHDAMIDLVIGNPWISQGEIAARFGYTQAWVSIVFSSDAFKNRLEERRAELVDPAIRVTLKERFDALVTRSLEVLQEKLSKHSSAVPDALALKTLELGARALNLGAQAPVVTLQPGSRLEALASRLEALNGPRVEKEIQGEIIDQAAEG